MNRIVQLYVPCESQESAQDMVTKLLEKKLIACANIVEAKSAYHWQGNIEMSKEYVALIKTSVGKKTRAITQIEKLHTYDTPCIIAKNVECNSSYYKWMQGVLTTG